MLFRHLIARSLHTSRTALAAGATDKSPSALATLRKKTGYTFANCKKALQLHQNDLPAAEKWLAEQAQSLGWSKATKLEGRTTRQGLVAVLVQRHIGAMLEVNCETDFVARNETFQEFVRSATRACAQHAAQLPSNAAANGGVGSLSKLELDAEYLRQVQLDGRSLHDQLALIIGKVGENATLRRATCFQAQQGVRLSGFAHPAAKTAAVEPEAVLLGKFGALVAVKDSAEAAADGEEERVELARNLGQHIVGMNPQRIGVQGVDEPAELKDDERSLIWQEYLLEPSMQVHEILAECGLEVVDFRRFECGEVLEAEKEKVAAEEQAATATA